jgi:transposase
MPRGPRFSDFEAVVIADGVRRGVSVLAIAEYLGRSAKGVRGWIDRERKAGRGPFASSESCDG